MSLEHLHVRRGRMQVETAGIATFGKDSSAALAGSGVDARFTKGAIKLGQEMLRDEAVVQQTYEERLDIVGKRFAEIDLEGHITPTGTGLDVAATPPADPAFWLGKFLQTIFGGYSATAGSTVVTTGTTASLLKVTDGHATRLLPGKAMLVPVTGGYEARGIASTAAGAGSEDDITPKIQFGSVPIAGTVYSSHTFFLEDDPQKAMAWAFETVDRSDVWHVWGSQCKSFAMELGLAQLAKFTASLAGAEWKHDSDVVTPIGGSLAVGTLTDGDPIPYIDSALFITKGSLPMPSADYDTVGYGRIPSSNVQITLNIPYEMISSPSGVNGVLRWKMKPGRPVATIQVTFPYQVENLFDDRAARVKHAFMTQIGNQPGKTVLIEVPTCQIIDVQPADSEHVIGQTVTLKAMADEYSTDKTTAIRRSPVKIHLL